MVHNKEEKKKTIIDILRVSLSNMIKLLAGILVGILLPKIVSVRDYGYYKTFTLYASYIVLFRLGFPDGIYLKYGGKSYNELEKNRFRVYSLFFLVLETILSLIIGILSAFFFSAEYRVIFLCLAFFLLVNNTTYYYQIVSQITSRFREIAIRNIIQSSLIAIIVITLWSVRCWINREISYRLYMISYIFVFTILAIWYIWTYRDITTGNRSKDFNTKKEIIELMKTGVPLMVADLCSSLILALDRQFVNVLFDNETYAVYAFAYNMLALVIMAVAAISTVLYPKLKQIDAKTLKNSYSKLISAILSLVFASMIIYFPLIRFVDWFLPNYSDSLTIFRISFPGLAISSAITIVMHNYYKALGETMRYFKKSVIILVVSGILNYLAYKIFNSTIAISFASVIAMIIWYVYAESMFVKKYNISQFRNRAYIILMMCAFYLITEISNTIIAGIIYAVVFSVITIILFYNELIQIIKK